MTNLITSLKFFLKEHWIGWPAVAGSLLPALEGLAFGDKGYIGKKLFDELFKKG